MRTPKVIIEENKVRYEFMDGSSIKVTPGKFEERASKEDFFADTSYMRRMFDVADKILKSGRINPSARIEAKESVILYAFNMAYFALSRVVERGDLGVEIDIETDKIPNVKPAFFEKFVYSIAYAIYRRTGDFYNVFSPKAFESKCDMKMYNTFTKLGVPKTDIDAICFGKIRCKAQKVEEDPFDASIKQVVEAYNKLKAIDKENSEQLESEKKKNAELEAKVADYDKLKTLNKENSEQLESEKKKNVELETKVADLEDRIKNYDVQVQQQELKIQILEKDKEKKAPSADGVSLEAMSEYILNLRDDQEVQVMMNLFNYMLRKGLASKEKLSELIDKFEAHKLNIQKPVAQQVNNFHSGATFNDIHNNDNSNIHTNGRG